MANVIQADKKGYMCPYCEEIVVDSPPTLKSTWVLEDVISTDDVEGEHYISFEPPRTTFSWECGECERIFLVSDQSPPEMVTLWECEECDSLWINRPAAEECC